MLHTFDHQGRSFNVLAHRLTPGWWDATIVFASLPLIRSEDEAFETEDEAVAWGKRIGKKALS